MNNKLLVKIVVLLCILVVAINGVCVYAAPENEEIQETEISDEAPALGIYVGSSENPKDVATSLQIILLITVLSLAPAILIMMTCFTRIIVILSFLRRALGTQQIPPNQVLIGLALFLTFFIMAPVGQKINNDALQPYLRKEISTKQAIERVSDPLREFMIKYTREDDIELFSSLSGEDYVESEEDIPMKVIIPAYIISELKTAFQVGFVIYVPFLIIDMVVASTLMSMGMMMLPPIMISLPFKVLLFIMVDGWNLIIRSIFTTFT